MIVFAASVLIISFINYSALDSTIRKNADENLEIFTNDILAQVEHLESILDATKHTLNQKHIAIAKSIENILGRAASETTKAMDEKHIGVARFIAHILAGPSADISPEALQRLAQPLDIIELSIADANGILIHSSVPEYIGFDYKKQTQTRVYMALTDGTLTELSEKPRVSLLPDGTDGRINHYTGVARPGGGFIQVGFNATEVMKKLDDDISPAALERLAAPLDIIELNIADSSGIIIHSNIPGNIGDDFKSGETTIKYMALAEGVVAEMAEEPRPAARPGRGLGGEMHFAAVSRADGGFIQLGFRAEALVRLKEIMNIGATIKKIKLGDNGFGFVLSNGTVRAHPDPAWTGRDVTGEEWYKTVTAGNGYARVTIDGALYYAGYQNKGGYTVVGLIPEADLNMIRSQLLTQNVVLSFVALMVMLGVMYNLMGEMVAPITSLVGKIGEISKGNLDVKIEDSYNNEFDRIKDAVNSMTADIKAYMMMISGIEYAGKIQRSLLAPQSRFAEAFADHSVIWEPKDIVGGDIYWLKKFEAGATLCVCDCTGHGTPGALLAMLVVSLFDSCVNAANCHNPAAIIWELEKRLVAALRADKSTNVNDGCDLAVAFAANDGSVRISAGNTNVFVCNGDTVTRFKGQRIRVGDGAIKSQDDINVISIPADPPNKFYIASDGLYEQIGGQEKIPFGYDEFERIILESHGETLSAISDKIWRAFEEYRGGNARRDDFELIAFQPKLH